MKVVRLDSPIEFSELLDNEGFLEFLKRNTSWLFGILDLETAENLYTVIPRKLVKFVKQKKLSAIPLTSKVDPVQDCFIVPNTGVALNNIFSKISELEKIFQTAIPIKETIGNSGLSIVDPAGFDSNGRLLWAMQIEDDLVEFFIHPNIEEQGLVKEIESFSLPYSIIETKNPGATKNWLKEFED